MHVSITANMLIQQQHATCSPGWLTDSLPVNQLKGPVRSHSFTAAPQHTFTTFTPTSPSDGQLCEEDEEFSFFILNTTFHVKHYERPPGLNKYHVSALLWPTSLSLHLQVWTFRTIIRSNIMFTSDWTNLPADPRKESETCSIRTNQWHKLSEPK